MENRGLCSTCAYAKTCIFVKDQFVIWQCEEFAEYAGSGASKEQSAKIPIDKKNK